jgi:hypothetical protein
MTRKITAINSADGDVKFLIIFVEDWIKCVYDDPRGAETCSVLYS